MAIASGDTDHRRRTPTENSHGCQDKPCHPRSEPPRRLDSPDERVRLSVLDILIGGPP
ncbi:hypothetical protein [Azospirillum palustre]